MYSWGNPHVNPAGHEMLEWLLLQLERLASVRSFFRAKGDRHSTWWHPKSGSDYSLDQILARERQLSRVQQACTLSALAVESDHIPTLLVLRVGRIQRRQKKANQSKPANRRGRRLGHAEVDED